VHFRTSDLDEVVAEIAAIADRSNGKEWITVSPWVDQEHLPVVSVLRQIFSGRGSKVPEATWVPGTDGEPTQVGFVHAKGAGANDLLVAAGVHEPERFAMMSDHSKRGLLFGVHPDVSAAEVITFVVDASAALAEVPTDDRWIAEVSTMT